MSDFGPESPFANIGMNGNVDYAQQNKGVIPVFFVEPIHDEKATEDAGAVRMREQEMVRIHVAGDQFNVASHPVSQDIIDRFPEHYKAWKDKRIDRHVVGTPLRNWPLMPSLRIAEFEAAKAFSVEDVAAISDANISRFPDGRIWREKATAWLASAKDSGAAAKYAAENERMRETMGEMQKQMDAMAGQLASLNGEGERRGPGRPRKTNAVNEITEAL